MFRLARMQHLIERLGRQRPDVPGPARLDGSKRLTAARGTIAVLAVAVVVGPLGLSPSTAAGAAPVTQPPLGTPFVTSFESAQPPPTWTSTTETGPDGKPKAAGITGPAATGIPGDVTSHVVAVKASAENPPNEAALNVVDGDPNSKWLAFTPTGWVELTLDAPMVVKGYAMTAANDAPDRDPKDWLLQGSADGATWNTLDTKASQDFAQRFEQRVFNLANTTAYLHYRLNISANHGGDLLQLADLALSDGSPATPPSGDMRVEVGAGPTSAYAAKTKVGFTGLKSLHYAGQVTGASGHAWDKVFDVNLPVSRMSELSYRLFPELTGNDLRYASTYAAVDLAFTDGTYLSDLKAVDNLGFSLSPRGQGESKALYTNQWNARSSSIGAVAAGKTIDRILVGYDSPVGPADFGGWIDDLTVHDAPVLPVGRPSDHVVTTRGTQSNSNFSRGNTFPATAVPQGFNFWTPVTNAGSTSWLYDYHRANDDRNRPRLQAFAASHEPSPWMGDRDTFQVMPSSASGMPDATRTGRSLSFSHDNEVAKAHYYGVTFDSGLKTEIAPADHSAMFRFTYPDANANLILDNVSNAGGLTIDASKRSFSGYSDVRAGDDGATRMYVVGTVDAPVTASGKLPGGGGANVTGYLKLDAPGAKPVVTMRIATSFISVDQARKNLDMEIPATTTFDGVRDAAQATWDKVLGRVEVEGASQDQLTTLYSNLYRMYLYPNSGSENTGTLKAPRTQYASPVQPAAASTPTTTGAKIVDGQIYVNNGFWDTYRTAWPAYSLLTPNLAAKLVDGFVQQYRDGGWVARWSSPGYANQMTGTSSDVAFADAFTKEVPLPDARSAYEAAVRNATVTPPGNPNNSNVGRKGLQQSIFLGYTPTSVGEGVSWALEGYVNDYGIAMMAKKLAEQPRLDKAKSQQYQTESAYFLNRAQNYVKMFDPKVDFFQGHDASGNPSKAPGVFDPLDWGGDYTETDAWNFAFHAPQDGQGLANLYGGRDGLAKKLDTFFATPETATHPGGYGGVIHEMTEARDVRMGQLGMSNQVSHHIPYMYDYAGQPSKTAKVVREIESRLFSGSEIGQGYAGDEDNGETSSWWLFSAMGFYPLQMGDGRYAVGSPLFTKMTVHLDNGKTLVVNAPNNSSKNVYVAGLKVNGNSWDASYLNHSDLANGGRLDFTMSPTPTSWATGKDSVPPSITKGDKVPSPLGDLTGPGHGQAAGVPSAINLVDNTSTTQASIPVNGSVTYRLVAPRNGLEQYTLTSGAAGADPKGWVLQGSNDGTNWQQLDRRSGESFAWRQQTRPFAPRTGGRYQFYRLIVIQTTTGGPASLSEIELLGRPGKPITDQQYVESFAQGLDLGDLSAVTVNLDLPGAASATTLAWKSSDHSWLTDAARLVRRPDVGQAAAAVNLTVTVSRGTATTTRDFAVKIAPWTAADSSYPAGTDLTTGFEDGHPQPLSNTRLSSVNVGEFCCGLGGMETTRGSAGAGGTHFGSALLLYSGKAIDDAPSSASSAVLPADGIWVKPGTSLSYWIHPESQTGGASTSQYVAMDLLFTDGTYLRGLEAKASNGGTSAPESQGLVLKTNTWQQVSLDVGSVAAGRQLQSVVLSFGSGTANGPFRGFVDDLTIAHAASNG